MRFEPEDTGPGDTGFAGELRPIAEPVAHATETDLAADKRPEVRSAAGAPPTSRHVRVGERHEDAGSELQRETKSARTLVVEEQAASKGRVPSVPHSSVTVDPIQSAPVEREQKSSRPHRHDEKSPLVAANSPRISQEQEFHRTTVSHPSKGQPATRREAIVRPVSEPSRRAIAHGSAAETPAPDPTPVIHVSIGRVEVRAVTTTSPRAAPPRSSAMSIDEYSAKHLGRR